MDTDSFARRFEELFRDTYGLAARRIRDKRDRMTPETLALLQHLALSGPLTLGELTRHLDRAASTLSEMIDPLIARGLVERDRDPADGRRHLIWLTAAGQDARRSAESVLDGQRLAAAAAALPEATRAELLRTLSVLVDELSRIRRHHD